MSTSCYLYRGEKMGTFWRAVAAGVMVLALAGCAAMGVIATSDPKQKLRDAYELFDHEYRPLPAERMIRESIEIYKNEKNDLGLAEAYRAYGFFFRSGAVEKWNKHYKKDGFMEPLATYNNRYDKSIEYFAKSETIYKEHKRYDALTNIYLNMAFTYEFAGDKAQACEAYKKSLSSNEQQMKDQPGSKVELPEGSKSYEEYVAGPLKRLGCK